MRAEDVLNIIRSQYKQPVVFRLGKIPSNYSSGLPQVIFDGETAPSIRKWPYLSSYTPAANDRVLVAMVGVGGVILGKIISN